MPVTTNHKTGILGRYKNINSPQGNSPVASSGQQFVNAFTLYPDQEDLDHDNTLNELEEYFEYKVRLTPAGSHRHVGTNFITDRRHLLQVAVFTRPGISSGFLLPPTHKK